MVGANLEVLRVCHRHLRLCMSSHLFVRNNLSRSKRVCVKEPVSHRGVNMLISRPLQRRSKSGQFSTGHSVIMEIEISTSMV